MLRRLSLSLLTLLGGCIASVQARPIGPVDCWAQIAPTPYCEADYVWVPGYWTRDGWGREHWVPGSYRLRRGNVRDHRW